MRKIFKLTREEGEAILKCQGGADVYDYQIAKTLRGLQQRRGSERYIKITKPMMYRGDGTDRMPYFGVMPSKIAIEEARAVV